MTGTPRTKDNLPRHELIGLEAEVVDAPDPTQVGLSGTIVDETRDTLVIETGDEAKQIAKSDRRFAVDLDGETVELDGSAIAYRPEDRTKKVTSW